MPKVQHGKMAQVVAALGLALLAAMMLASCAKHPQPLALPQMAGGKAPAIDMDMESGLHKTHLSVLIYNVAGLPWPVGTGRHRAFKIIERDLHQLMAEGRAPDIVMLQEAFTARAARTGINAGYPNWVQGPRSKDKITVEQSLLDGSFLRARRVWKGEKLGKALSSGLYIYSVYPITALSATPFGRHTCAGYDCLANKGVMLARIEIPGVPEPIQVLNTHLNSRDSSGVNAARSLYAHQHQVDEIKLFLDRDLHPHWPFIYGGDFNTRRSNSRFDHKVRKIPGTVVDYYCAVIINTCEVLMSWDGDEPWMDTQDLQGFRPGNKVWVKPARLEAMFDEPHDGRRLSDHDGYLVTYELTWSSD